MGHATLAHAILNEEGIAARLVVGAAAWRVGPGDSDVITHLPTQENIDAISTVAAFPYHAWLEFDDTIIDFSTHSLQAKGQQLDAQDGGRTTVDWCPDYLTLDKAELQPLEVVVQSSSAGVAFYKEIPGLHRFLVSRGLRKSPDPQDVTVLRFIYANPSLKVIGPNHPLYAEGLTDTAHAAAA